MYLNPKFIFKNTLLYCKSLEKLQKPEIIITKLKTESIYFLSSDFTESGCLSLVEGDSEVFIVTPVATDEKIKRSHIFWG